MKVFISAGTAPRVRLDERSNEWPASVQGTWPTQIEEIGLVELRPEPAVDRRATLVLEPLLFSGAQEAGTRLNLKLRSVWMSHVAERLIEMRLNPDPDIAPYPAAPALEEAWRVALDLLPPSAPTPSVLPGEEGGVDFVWHKAGWDIELEIKPLAASVWARNRRTGETWEGPLDELWTRFSATVAALAD